MRTHQATRDPKEELPAVQRIVSVLWPSFLTAGAATILFFTVFDPEQLSLIAGGPEITRTGGYSIGFFLFWILTASSSALTCYFRRPCGPESRRDPGSTGA
jgi:hypothetical protein